MNSLQNNSSVWIQVPIDASLNRIHQPFYFYNKVTNEICFSLQDRTYNSKSDDEDDDEEEDEKTNRVPGWTERIENGRKVYYNDAIKMSTLVPPLWPKGLRASPERSLNRAQLSGRSISISSTTMRNMVADWKSGSRRSLDFSGEDAPMLPPRTDRSDKTRSAPIEIHKPAQPTKPLPEAPNSAPIGMSKSLPDDRKVLNSAQSRSKSSLALSKQFLDNLNSQDDLDLRADKRRPKSGSQPSDGRKMSMRLLRTSSDKQSRNSPSPTKEIEAYELSSQWNDEAQKLAQDWAKVSLDLKDVKWEQSIIGDSDHAKELIDLECVKLGFNVESGKTGAVLSHGYPILEEERDFPFYRDYFASAGHCNYWALDETLGPIVVSIEDKKSTEQMFLRALIRTKRGDKRASIIGAFEQILPYTEKDRIKALKLNVPEIANVKFHTIKKKEYHDEIVKALNKYEKDAICKNYKFGILYVANGQKEENQFFTNVETTPAFENFLNCIGDKVELKGWSNFAGGLDTKKESTGSHSIYASHKGCEIMFHVSTMLPFFPMDDQQVERKRHIGNDVILIVFKEGDGPFQPQIIASQFNHVFIVVQPEPDGCHFRIAIANKFGVKPYGPPLPAPAVFELGASLKEFLLTKLINAERSAMYAPDFRQRMTKTREISLKHIITTLTALKLEREGRKRAVSLKLTLPSFMKSSTDKKKDASPNGNRKSFATSSFEKPVSY